MQGFAFAAALLFGLQKIFGLWSVLAFLCLGRFLIGYAAGMQRQGTYFVYSKELRSGEMARETKLNYRTKKY